MDTHSETSPNTNGSSYETNSAPASSEIPQPMTRHRSVMRMRTTVKNARAGMAYQQANAKMPGVITLPSGLQYQVLRAGKGAKPTLKDTVEILYEGSSIDGKTFVHTVDRQTASLKVAEQIIGLQEALQLMKTGSKWRLVVPPQLGFGVAGSMPDIGPEATLVYDVELVAIKPVKIKSKS